MTLKTLRS